MISNDHVTIQDAIMVSFLSVSHNWINKPRMTTASITTFFFYLLEVLQLLIQLLHLLAVFLLQHLHILLMRFLWIFILFLKKSHLLLPLVPDLHCMYCHVLIVLYLGFQGLTLLCTENSNNSWKLLPVFVVKTTQQWIKLFKENKFYFENRPFH